MKCRYFFYLALLLGCTGCVSTAERQRMQEVMSAIDSLNRNFVSLADDSLMPAVTEWMDRYGSPNERMRAHYLRAAVYRDRNQTPEALAELQTAAQYADTTSTDCDYKCLCRVFSQMMLLYSQQNLMETALDIYDRAVYYAYKSKDTAAILSLTENCSIYFYHLGEVDKALETIFQVYSLYCQHGDTLSANTALGPAIGIYIEKNEYEKAKKLLKQYESHSILTGKSSFDELQFYYLYYYKGKCFIYDEKYDSASYCFRKQISEGVSLENIEQGNRGLYQLYRKLGKADSISKYADICFALNDSMVKASIYYTMQQMKSMYDYSSHQEAARKASERAERLSALCAILFLLFLLISVIVYFFVRNQRLRSAQKINEIVNDYAVNMLTYQRLKIEHKSLKEKEHENQLRIAELESEIEKIQDLIAQTQDDKKGPNSWGLEDVLLDSPIVALFHVRAARGMSVTDEEWAKLRTLVNHCMPNFFSALSGFDYQMNLKETNICILIKLRFSPLELCNLFNMKSSAISNMRSRLYAHLFKEKGTATEFDDKIRSMQV